MEKAKVDVPIITIIIIIIIIFKKIFWSVMRNSTIAESNIRIKFI